MKHHQRDDGMSLIAVLLIGVVATALAGSVASLTEAEIVRAGAAKQESTAFQAAEAGVDDYVAKLTEDRLYYGHFLHPAENDRTPTASQTTDAQGVRRWTGDLAWGYTSTDRWAQLDNGYEYHLAVAPPDAARNGVRITSTGRRIGDDDDVRTIEVLVRTSTVADYFMITNSDIRYGATATTHGKVYAGIDAAGVPHNIEHDGVAHADLYAEGYLDEDSTLTYQDGAGAYSGYTNTGVARAATDPLHIRSKVGQPINFGDFVVALADIRRAAQYGGGLLLDDPSVHGWRLTFRSNGTVDVAKCTRIGSAHLASASRPTCTAYNSYPVPAIGAIYVEQSVIVSGTGTGSAASQVSWVNGRVTVASNADIIVGNDIQYVQRGEDVLGLIARNDVIIAKWTPTNLTWFASVIAQTGRRRSYDSTGSHGTADFTGSVATNLSPYMDMFQVRNYNYDVNLLYLQPPYFPVLEEAYTVLFYRELDS
jgi:hypothetical protein